MKIPINSGRLIAVGDIHGHSKLLRAILTEIDPQPDDVFVFLGDYIDRGPDSKGVIDEILALKEKCLVYTILGNHEEMVLACLYARSDPGDPDHAYWCKYGGKEALASYNAEKAEDLPREHILFITHCLDYVETDDFIFVHAGANPYLPIEKNESSTYRWDKFPKEPKPHHSGKTVICGHTAQKTILDLGFICCIDTGCGIWVGGRLTAMDLKSGKIWQMGLNYKKVAVKQRENHE